MMLIPLKGGSFAMVDDADYEWLSQYSWKLRKPRVGRENRSGKGRKLTRHTAYAETYKDGSQILMHRLILGLARGDATQVDHRDENGLNNQRSNLRRATCAHNQAARSYEPPRASRFRGVFKKGAKFGAHIGSGSHGTRVVLGNCFLTEEEAARAYDRAAKKRFGEFARLNFQ